MVVYDEPRRIPCPIVTRVDRDKANCQVIARDHEACEIKSGDLDAREEDSSVGREQHFFTARVAKRRVVA